MKSLTSILLALVTLVPWHLSSADAIATLRNGTEINQGIDPAIMQKVVNEDIISVRNYPMQPPVIPHTIRGYEINLEVNKCMACHARENTEDSQATMISVTHYMDRDGNFLAELSPRRYYCTQCHVIQLQGDADIDNDFVDMHSIVEKKAK